MSTERELLRLEIDGILEFRIHGFPPRLRDDFPTEAKTSYTLATPLVGSLSINGSPLSASILVRSEPFLFEEQAYQFELGLPFLPSRREEVTNLIRKIHRATEATIDDGAIELSTAEERKRIAMAHEYGLVAIVQSEEQLRYILKEGIYHSRGSRGVRSPSLNHA